MTTKILKADSAKETINQTNYRRDLSFQRSIMIITNTRPAADGFRMPAEYEPHIGTFMIWPERPGSWCYGAKYAREAFRNIIFELAKGEEVYVLASENAYDSALSMLKKSDGTNSSLCEHIHIIKGESDDAWARDVGPTFVVNKAAILRGIDWQFNAWGGTFDGLYASWDKDQEVARILCNELKADIYDARDFVLEGGSIHVDGKGTLLTTKECLLSQGRNPSMTQEEIENKLKDYLNLRKIIWLDEGIYNDETNGHVDNFACFTESGKVLLAWTDDVDDPQYTRSKAAYDILVNETDADGNKIEVIKLPIPSKPILITEDDLKGYEFEEGEDTREVGERLAASYVNFYVGNESVLVPQFGDVNDKLALDIIGQAFPSRKVVGIAARDILLGGGNIHCITQQIPLP